MQFIFILTLMLFCINCSEINATFPQIKENSQFCIRQTEFDNKTCEINVLTLSAKEKGHLLKTVCQELKDTRSIDRYYYFKLRNGELTGRAVHNEVCESKTNNFLAWLPYTTMQRYFLSELNPTEHLNYIGKAIDVDSNTTEFCHFQHSDLVANSTSNLYNCVTLISEDNFSPLGENIVVLVEIQPLLYELRNLTYLPWANMSHSYKTMLGQSMLRNHNTQIKQIYGSLTYAYAEKIKLNLTTVFNEKLEKLPLLVEHKNSTIALDELGNGAIDIKEKSYFGRVLPPHSTIKVDLVGQWAELSKHCSADVYDYFGQGIQQFRQTLHHAVISFTRITSTEPVFEDPVSVSKKQNSLERLIAQDTDTIYDMEEEVVMGPPYPNFYKFTIIGAVIVGSALISAVCIIVHAFSKKRALKEKQKYQVTSTHIH